MHIDELATIPCPGPPNTTASSLQHRRNQTATHVRNERNVCVCVRSFINIVCLSFHSHLNFGSLLTHDAEITYSTRTK